MKPSNELLQALAVTAEVTGTALSPVAARVMAGDLMAYPFHATIEALKRCRRELTGKLTLAAIIERLDDGRPGPEEAWALIPTDESASVVWTEEMASAYGVCAGLVAQGELIPARMAFLEAYRKRLALARGKQESVRWTPSLGHDPFGRETVLLEALKRGRLTQAHVAGLLPHTELPVPEVAALIPDLRPAGHSQRVNG